MSKGMEWILKLEDRMSDPAEKAEKRLHALENRIKALTEVESKLSDPASQKKIAARLSSLRLEALEARASSTIEKHATGWRATAAAVGGFANAAEGALGIVEKIGEGMMKIGEKAGELVLEFAREGIAAAASKEATIETFRALLGSQEAAVSTVEALERQSAVARFSADEMTTFGRKLLAVGGEFNTGNVATYLTALSDAAAAVGANPEKVERAVSAMARVGMTGKLTEKTLLQIAAAGVPTSKVYEVLAKDLHTTAAEAQALVKAGKINANEGLWAVVGGVALGRSQGMLGSQGKRYAKETFAGLQKNFRFFKEELLGDLFATGGFGGFKGFWQNINEAINPESQTGTRVRARVTEAFDRMFSTIFGPMAGEGGAEVIERLIGKVVFGADVAIAGIRGMWAAVEGFASGVFGKLGPSVDSIFGADGKLNPDAVDAVVEKVREMSKSFGETVISIELAAAELGVFVDKINLVATAGKKVAGLFGFGDSEEESRRAGLDVLDRAMYAERLQQMTEQMKAQIRARAALPPKPGATAGGGGRTVNANATVNQSFTYSGGSVDPRGVGSAAKAGAEDAFQVWDDAYQSIAGGDD